jgi:hypothetical protein
MVIIKSRLMEVVSVVIQHPLNPLYPMVEEEFQFRLLNFTQKFLNASEKILWPGELSSCQSRLHVPESQKSQVRRCEVRTVGPMGYSNNRIFSKEDHRGLCAVDAAAVKVQT